MTTDRDFDRLARAWLDLMPDEAPDEAIEAVLQAVETTPQVRRPGRWPSWRFPAMNRAPALVGAAAVIAVAGMGIFFASRSGPPAAAQPTPNPSSSGSPSANAAGGPVPTELRAFWMGGHSDLVAADAGTVISFEPGSFRLNQSAGSSIRHLESTATATADAELRLESIAAGDGCQKGDVGTYTWSLVPSGRALTITKVQDACASRAASLAGVWQRMDCPTPDDNCLGVVDAGTYESQFITPRLKPGASWSPVVGALTYTVPDGWANSSDFPETFELVPASALGSTPVSDVDRSIGIATRPAPLAKNATCESLPPAARGTTVDELVSWIGDVPGLVSTAPKSITIGGHPGQWLDIRADPAFTTGCKEGGKSLIEYQTAMYSGLIGAERQRLIYLDLGDGDVVSITIRTVDPAAFAAFVTEAMPIVESLTFE